MYWAVYCLKSLYVTTVSSLSKLLLNMIAFVNYSYHIHLCFSFIHDFIHDFIVLIMSKDVVALKEPELCSPAQRCKLMVEDEKAHFSEEHYL